MNKENESLRTDDFISNIKNLILPDRDPKVIAEDKSLILEWIKLRSDDTDNSALV